MEFLWRRISLPAAAIFTLKWTAHRLANKIILKEARPPFIHFTFSTLGSIQISFIKMDSLLAPQCQPPQNPAPTQLDLLLAALISNSSSSPSSTNLNLLNNLASLLGIRPIPPCWPSPLPFSPQFAIGQNNNNLAQHFSTQFDNNSRAHSHLLIPPSPSQICPLPTIPLLPTCTMPDFNAHHFLAASLSAAQSNLLAMTSVGDLPLPPSSLPSPSDTSSSASSSSIIGEEIRNNLEEATIESGTKNANNNNDPNIRCHRLSYPREFKLIVLHSFWANGQNKYRTCKEFQITKSMLNGWLQKANKIRNSRPGSLKSGRSGRRPQFPKIERQLFGLLRQQIANGNEPQQISNKWIRENARRLAEMELESAAGDRNENGMDRGQIPCQFSERWVNNFKRRFGIQKEGEELILEEEAEATKDGQKLMENSTRNGDEQKEQNLTEDLSEKDLERIGREICASSSSDGQLPIQAFYARFPKVSIGIEQK